MPASIHKLTFPGRMNQRGFWLYVWRIESSKGTLLYVGRTGDSSSPNASSPIRRMGQHLDPKGRGNMLWRYLKDKDVSPETCSECTLVAYGPLFPEEKHFWRHREPRNKVAALEKKLADTLLRVGYRVMNTVDCKHAPDKNLWHDVREAFSTDFPKLAQLTNNDA